MEEKIKPLIKKAKQDKDVLAVALFGSYARDEEYRDIDICIFLNKKMTNKEITNKRLDFLKDASSNLDIHIFQQLPLYIKIRVLKDAKILFCKNDEMLYELAFLTINDFDSFKKLYDMYLGEVENG